MQIDAAGGCYIRVMHGKPPFVTRSPETLRHLVNHMLEGELDDLLRSWSAAGVSGAASARLLAQRIGGVQLDERTVLKWIRSLNDQAA